MTWLASTVPQREDPLVTTTIGGPGQGTGLGRPTARVDAGTGGGMGATGGGGADTTPSHANNNDDSDSSNDDINVAQKPRHLRLAVSRPASPRSASKRKGGGVVLKSPPHHGGEAAGGTLVDTTNQPLPSPSPPPLSTSPLHNLTHPLIIRLSQSPSHNPPSPPILSPSPLILSPSQHSIHPLNRRSDRGVTPLPLNAINIPPPPSQPQER